MLLCVTPILEHLIAHRECVLVIYVDFVLRYGYCVFYMPQGLLAIFILQFNKTETIVGVSD